MCTLCLVLIPFALIGIAAVLGGAYLTAVLLVEAWKR